MSVPIKNHRTPRSVFTESLITSGLSQGIVERKPGNITVGQLLRDCRVAKNFIVEFTGKPAGVLAADDICFNVPIRLATFTVHRVFGSTDFAVESSGRSIRSTFSDLNKVTWGGVEAIINLLRSCALDTRADHFREMTCPRADGSVFDPYRPDAWVLVRKRCLFMRALDSPDATDAYWGAGRAR